MQIGCVETGLQLISRLSKRPTILNLDETLFLNQLKPGETVEISGNVSSGKTFLITQLLANCVLPSITIDLITIGGQNAGAILIDTDHHFRMSLMTKIMKSRILHCYKSINKIPSERAIEETIKSAYNNLTIINCFDGLQYRLTVLSLENKLLYKNDVALVVVDGLVSFYWEDRNRDNIWFKDSYLKFILNLLQKCTTLLYRVVLIYTIPSDFMPKDKDYFTWSSVENTNHRINLFRSDSNDSYGAIRSKNCDVRIFNYKTTDDSWKWT